MAKTASSASGSRRKFLRLAALLGGAAALQACSSRPASKEISPAAGADAGSSPTPARQPATAAPATEIPRPTEAVIAVSPTPAEAAAEGSARIAFVKTTDRASGVRQAVELLGGAPVSGKDVFLKPNFNSADPAPGSTHPDVLAALVALLNEMGAQRITVGDRSGMGNTRQVMEQIGVFRMAKELGFDTVVFDELPGEGWVMFVPPGTHWEKGFAVARPCIEAGALVQTCCLKTHRYGGHFTLSLKNSVGMVAKQHPQMAHDLMRELHGSPHQRRMIAEINAAYTPALVVLDGVEAFISGGPDVGERVTPGVMLAGTDRVALDAAGIALLRHAGCQTEAGQGKIFEQEQIARAVEMGLGVDRPEKIEFVTGDADSAAFSEAIRAVLLEG